MQIVYCSRLRLYTGKETGRGKGLAREFIFNDLYIKPRYRPRCTRATSSYDQVDRPVPIGSALLAVLLKVTAQRALPWVNTVLLDTSTITQIT